MQCNVVVLGDSDLNFVMKILQTSEHKRIYAKSYSRPWLYQTIHVDVIHDMVDSIQVNFVKRDHTVIRPSDVVCDESTIVLAVLSKYIDDTLVNFISQIPNLNKCNKVYAVARNSFVRKQRILDRTDIFNDFIAYLDYNPHIILNRLINDRLHVTDITRTIVAPTVALTITMYVEIINDCVSPDRAIDLILSKPYSILSQFIIHHVKHNSYLIYTSSGYVELTLVESPADRPDIHAVVCKRHDAIDHLSDQVFLPDTVSAVFLITNRYQCPNLYCDMDCNSEWSLFHTVLQRRIKAAAIVEVPTLYVQFAIYGVLNLFMNGRSILY